MGWLIIFVYVWCAALKKINAQHAEVSSPSRKATGKPLALVVFLENVGHIAGLKLPLWAMDMIDFVTEEYAKAMLHLYGAYRRYDRVIVLEDERATGSQLAAALLGASRTHSVDMLLLVHGHDGQLVGYRGRERVGAETFDELQRARLSDPASLDLRMVYGLNCYGLSLAPRWLALGAKVANGSAGVNWFPEPSLSIFLHKWLGGSSYSQAVIASNATATRWWGRLLNSRPDQEHPWICSSRQVIMGEQDLTIGHTLSGPREPAVPLYSLH